MATMYKPASQNPVLLTKDQQIALDETYNDYCDEVTKLQNKFQELETLLDLADTYEQKHDLLVKYEIIKD